MNHLVQLLMVGSMIAAPWFVAACGTVTDDGGEEEGRQAPCDTICRRAVDCDVASRSDCQDACRNDQVTSSAALQVIANCAQDVSCAGLSSGQLATCVTNRTASLEPTPAIEQYCEDLSAWSSRCLGQTVQAAECESSSTTLSNSYLEAISVCFSRGCDNSLNCLEASLSEYDEDESILAIATAGFSSSGGECCSATDPCDWADDGYCDCSGDFAWDALDCGGTGSCCSASDPCDWADDGYCDCQGEFAWDAADCSNSGGECCSATDPCDWANDGYCDCGGTQAWDANDCGSAGGSCCGASDPCDWANDGYCDCEGEFAWDAVDCADAAGDCCSASDPCNWANDGYCDCEGTQTWDANDCF